MATLTKMTDALTQIANSVAPAGLPLTAMKEFLGLGSNIDVVRDYKWYTESIEPDQIPYIELEEFELTNNALYSTANYIAHQLKNMTATSTSFGDQINPYEGLYNGIRTGVVYKFPYVSSNIFSSQSSWNATDFGGGLNTVTAAVNFATDAADAVSTTFNLSPSTSMVKPRVFGGTVVQPIEVEFYIFNTYTTDSSDWFKNWQLITYLRLSVLHNQRNIVLSVPPSIFTVNIPGVRYSPVSVISQLTITQLGNVVSYDALPEYVSSKSQGMNTNKPKGPFYIPDAWKINIRIEDLIPMSRQILANGIIDAGNASSITAITEKIDVSDFITEASDAEAEALQAKSEETE